MRERVIGLIGIIVVTAAIIGAGIGAAYWSETSACMRLHMMVGVETDVSVSLGCMVKYNGEWVARSVMTTHKQTVTVK